MKKSDILTATGIIAGSILLLIGMATGSTLTIFWDLPSVLITVGGSFSAVLITFSLSELKALGKILAQTFKEAQASPIELIGQFVNLSRKARKEGLLSLEEQVEEINDNFFKKGMQMAIDGFEPEAIREILELEISEMEARHLHGAKIIAAWGAYAPAFGMLGTLIGLIQMLQNLTDVNNIASGMGKALITTFYGSVLANLFLNPLSENLKNKNLKEVTNREMIVEGVLSIQSGVNPRLVEEKLLSYLGPKDKQIYLDSLVTSEE